MKKILILIPSMENAGGAEKLAVNLSNLFHEFYEVSIASFDSPGTPPYFKLVVPFYPLGSGPKLPLPFRFITYVIAANRVRKLKKDLSVGVAISILWRADLINSLSRGRDRIISLIVINFVGNVSNVRMLKLRFFVSLVFRRFDRILAITREISNEVTSLFVPNEREVGIFPTFLPPSRVSSVFVCRRVRFVFCGRAVFEKNIDGLLAVFNLAVTRYPEYQLIIIGDGPLLEDMKTIARDYGLTVSTDYQSAAQVLFVGTVEDPEEYMIGSCAFLMTSRHEGIPTVAILAASLGLPLLVADCKGGGMRDFFDISLEVPLAELVCTRVDVPSGALLPIPEPSDAHALEIWVAALTEAATNETLRKRRNQGALKLASKYSPTSVLSYWNALIEDVTQS